MKIRYLLLIILVGLLTSISCKKQEMVSKEIGDILILSNNSVSLNDIGTTNIILVTTNKESYEVSASETWCKFVTSGDTLKVSADLNEENGRKATITIIAGTITSSVSVTQKAGVTPSVVIEDIEFVKVAGGNFMMGSQNSEPSAPNYGVADGGSNYNKNQTPIHKVTLSDFYIGKFQVTQAQWMKIMGSNPSFNIGSDKGKYPVEYVTWPMAKAFCERLSQETGKNFRLPTEAEWEYAAIGGKKSLGYLYSGSNNAYEVGNFSITTDDRNTHATTKVGLFKPNELGIYDMCGNVYEWTSNYFGPYPSDDQVNPTGPSTGTNRVARGASWWHYKTTVYYRGSAAESYTGTSPNAGLTGLRLVYIP